MPAKRKGNAGKLAKAAKRKAVVGGKAAKRVDEDEQEGREQEYSSAELRSQCNNYFRSVASGQYKASTQEEIAQAKVAEKTFAALDTADRTAFAKTFYSNKGSKNFGFVRDYQEKVSFAKSVTEQIGENYYTRTACIMS